MVGLKETTGRFVFRDKMLPPLPEGCALAAIATAPANIIKC